MMLTASQRRWQRLAGNRRLILAALLLFLGSCWLSFWAFFPAEVLQRRLVLELAQQTGLQMEGKNARMLFPLGLQLDLQIVPRQPELAAVDLNPLQLRPAWWKSLSGSPTAELQATVADGELAAEVDRQGGVDLQFQNLALLDLQRSDLAYRLQGRLSGRLAGERLTTAAGKGEFAARLRAARLLGGAALGLPDDLSLGEFQVEGKFAEQRLSLERLLLTEGVVELSGGGTVLVGDSPEQTRLNLNLRLHPTVNTPDELRNLLNLTGVKPTADGSYLLRIGGTLALPQLR